MGVARCSSVKERNLVEKDHAKMYVILNKQSTIQRMNKIELYCLLLYMRGAPCMFTPDSSNRVRGLDDLSNALVGEVVFSVRLPRRSHSLRRTNIAQYFHSL